MYFDQLFLHDALLADCTWCKILPWLALLLAVGLGYLLGSWLNSKYKSMVAGLEKDVNSWRARYNDMEKDHASLKYKYDELDKDHGALRSSLKQSEADIATYKAQSSQWENKYNELSAGGMALGVAAGAGAVESAEEDLETETVEAPEVDEVEVAHAGIDQDAGTTASTDAGGIAAAGAVAATTPEDKEDDYLACREYQGRKVNDQRNNVALFKHEDGQYYFALYDTDGEVRLRSEGFRTSKERDQELSGVLRYSDNEDMYKRISVGKYYMDVLYDKSGREVGRSCLKRTEDAASSSPAPEAQAETAMGTAAPDMSGYGAYGRYFQNDNLMIVEGVGPKIGAALNNNGIRTWGDLANASKDRLLDILNKAGISSKINDPTTWPEQARLANAGEWEKLVEYQKFLDTGMERKGDFETPAKIEKLFQKAAGISSKDPEDLKIVEGIGPKTEQLLKDQGINNWQELADTSVDRLKSILSDAGGRFQLANPGTWPKQARLAANGQWSELQEYQDFLDGGVAPS